MVTEKLLIMKNTTRSARILFAIPWIVFGIQHYMYADFVATLVPAYMPARIFWAYLTGTAMIAAGISFVIGVKVRLAATLLGIDTFLFDPENKHPAADVTHRAQALRAVERLLS